MRWFWAIVLAGFLATASSLLVGSVAAASGHDQGPRTASLSLATVISDDHCPAQQGSPDKAHKGCCGEVMCGGAGALEVQPVSVAVQRHNAARHLAADARADGRDFPPETGPPRAHA